MYRVFERTLLEIKPLVLLLMLDPGLRVVAALLVFLFLFFVGGREVHRCKARRSTRRMIYTKRWKKVTPKSNDESKPIYKCQVIKDEYGTNLSAKNVMSPQLPKDLREVKNPRLKFGSQPVV